MIKTMKALFLRRSASFALALTILESLAQPLEKLPPALEALRSFSRSSTSTSTSSAWSSITEPAPRQQSVQPPPPPPKPQSSEAFGSPQPASQMAYAIRMKLARAEQNKVPLPQSCRATRVMDAAVVTLISSSEGYPAGALAISAALEVLESELRRIVLVTPAVNAGIRELLRSAAWEVDEVPEIMCNQVMGAGVTPDKYDIGISYQQKRAKWLSTCTKFHAWALTSLRKVLFLDADTLVLKPVDALVDHPSAFAAAPDTFPADQFNSGVMVITPSASVFEALKAWNRVNGTAEGGDQCLLNDFFGEWFYAAWDDATNGRLPWIFNVGAAQYPQYKTLTKMQSRDEPAIVHFVGGESKPWGFMMLKFQGADESIPENARRLLDAWDDMYWLAKTNRVCAGTLSADERAAGRLLLSSA